MRRKAGHYASVKNNSLSKQVPWMLVASISPALTMWLVAVIIARSHGPVALGTFAYAIAIVTPIVLILQLPMRTLHITDPESSSDLRAMLGIRMVMLALSVVVIAVSGVFLLNSWAELVLLMAVTAYRVCDSYCDLLHASLQRLDQIGSIAALVAIRCTLVISTALVSSFTYASLEVMICGLAATSIFTSIAFDTQFCSRYQLLWPAKVAVLQWKLQLTRIVPLSASQGLNAISGSVPRFAVQAFGGSHLLGLYAVLEHVAMVTSLLVNALGQTMTASMARHWNGRQLDTFRSQAKQLFVGCLSAASIVTIVTSILGAPILEWVYGSEFLVVQPFILIASSTALVMAVVSALGYILTSSGAFREQIHVIGVSLAATIAAIALATPVLGLAGVYLGMVLGAFVQITLSLRLLIPRMRGNQPDA